MKIIAKLRRLYIKPLFMCAALCALVPLFAREFYWEQAVPLTQSDSRFPAAVFSPGASVVIWQEVEQLSGQKGNIWLSAQVLPAGSEEGWISRERFAGPFPFSGEVPDLFSAAVTTDGAISVCVLSDPKTISVFTSYDFGKTFFQTDLVQDGSSAVAPRIFKNAGGGFILFATQGTNQSFSLKYARSSDGIAWSAFEDFSSAKNLKNSFVPDFIVLPGGREIVVFQSLFLENNRLTYQLYSAYSDDNGMTWSDAALVTDTKAARGMITNYTNQRPFLHEYKGTLYLAWERSQAGSTKPAIVVTSLSEQGLINGTIEQLSPKQIAAYQPVLFTYNGELSALWVDTRRGVENVYLAVKNNLLWDESRVSLAGLYSVFGTPLVTDDGKNLHIFWEQKSNNKYRVTRLSIDRSTEKPLLRPLTFKNGQRSGNGKIGARIQFPRDSSGIAGYSWILTRNAQEEPPEEFMRFPSQSDISDFVDTDGLWYLKAKSVDNAGNWSKSAVLTYFRDTTAPRKPEIRDVQTDDEGFMQSNTFSLFWEKSPEPDEEIAGYTYSLQYIGSLFDYKKNPERYTAQSLRDYKSSVPSKIITDTGSASWVNRDNGIYLFTVASIDTAGNIGEKALMPLFLNKYIPYTAISAVYPQTDVYGKVSLSIFGKGFRTDGRISAVYVDRDGKAPYDAVFEYASGGFQVLSDTKIGGITFSDLESGEYRIGLLHPERGLFMSAPLLNINEFGTVKTGDYAYRFVPPWKEYRSAYRYSFEIGDIILWAVFVLAAAGLFFVSRHMMLTIRESLSIQYEVQALITGDIMMSERKKKAFELKQRGVSLKYKMIVFTSALILLLTLFVSVPLGFIFVRTQEKTLAKGLEDRISVLTESLSSGVKNYLPGQNILELGLLLNQIQSMPEIRYATVLGLKADNSNTNLDYVWASNDPDIAQKIDTENLVLGSSRFIHEETAVFAERIPLLNEEAEKQVGKVNADIVALTSEGIALALKTDARSVERRNEIQQVTSRLTQTLTRSLNEVSKVGEGSLPEFNNESLSRNITEYVFYKPVLYRRGTDRNYVRAVILLKVSTEDLIKNVNKSTVTVISIAGGIAFVAVLIGIAGSLILALIIIKPLRRLASHVVMIRDTGDKTELAGKDIPVTAGDEIGLLSENVNDMTRALVEAAVNANMLLGGKEVQRAFLPLDEVIIGGKKVKQSVGRLDTPHAQFFGYYEGAKGVSGDYFDYKKLDERHFAVIKVDVSGKGSPAALIMAEVAALFTDYFNGWSIRKNGTDLSPLVYKINDHLVNRNLFGKFAAFTLAIFDSVAGDFYFCNAGDNLIHIYDASERKKKVITLTATPTAGAFSSDLVEMKGGYPIEKVHLDSGDILFLYTDGIEEAKRLYRDDDGRALKFRDETDVRVTKEEEDGYQTYLKLCADLQEKRRTQAFSAFEEKLGESLRSFLREKASDMSDPKKYLADLYHPRSRVKEYTAYAKQQGENPEKAKVFAAVKMYDKLSFSKELVRFIKKLNDDVYNYIVYMGQKGSSVVDGEEMSADRVHDIIEAVFQRKSYVLEKRANPRKFFKDESFEFDFSDCEGSPEDGVMALVAVEKIFRMYKTPEADDYDHSVVDKKIDAFLKKHFVQYPVYCGSQAEHFQSGLRDEYMFYTRIKEDEQFDDLTLVGIKKK
ncbi:SpoIIE family protein phosphatase [Treponema sp. HNW]|uniref:SpoIIE family protein phosphatase n=1 Tax=Treponema sp. HNW TaxID=3116654 RepID=UPI003D0BB1ED